MIKTIDTSLVAPEMETAMKAVFVQRFLQRARAFDRGITDDQAEAGWNSSRQGYIEHVRAALEAAPEVKGEPVYFEYADLRQAWVLCTERDYNRRHDENRMKLYAHPPVVSADVVERIRALECGGIDGDYADGFIAAINIVLSMIEEAKCTTQND